MAKVYQYATDGPSGDCASCGSTTQMYVLRPAPCGHSFCRACLKRMAHLALRDRTLVPLRCCQKELPIDYVKSSLPSAHDFDTYKRYLCEREWKSSDLLSDAEYKQTVHQAGGKQCPGCGVGVIRDWGCVHMTCPNGHQFCYTCLKVWQTCSCALIPASEIEQIIGR